MRAAPAAAPRPGHPISHLTRRFTGLHSETNSLCGPVPCKSRPLATPHPPLPPQPLRRTFSRTWSASPQPEAVHQTSRPAAALPYYYRQSAPPAVAGGRAVRSPRHCFVLPCMGLWAFDKPSPCSFSFVVSSLFQAAAHVPRFGGLTPPSMLARLPACVHIQLARHVCLHSVAINGQFFFPPICTSLQLHGASSTLRCGSLRLSGAAAHLPACLLGPFKHCTHSPVPRVAFHAVCCIPCFAVRSSVQPPCMFLLVIP